jgi:hypothetical protein
MLVKVDTEFKVGRRETETLDHPKSPVENFSWVNRRPVRDSPVVADIFHQFAHSSRT